MAPLARMPIGTLHYVEQVSYKAEKALVAAKFNGLLLNKQKFNPEKDGKSPDFLAKNPTGKVPFLETDMGCIFTSNAIARYVARCRADTDLYGRCLDDEGSIDTWMDFCTHELEVPLMTWVYPVMGVMEDIPEATKCAQADVKKAMTALEDQLKSSPYLIGDFLSLADVVTVCALREGFARVFDPAFRKPYPKVNAWFETCCGLPQFKAVLGDVKLCAQAGKPVPPQQASKAPAAASKEEKKAAAPAKKEAKAASPKPTSAPAAAAPSGGGDADAKVKEVGDQIRALKEKLKADGLSGKKINDHEEVKALVAQLTELKKQCDAAPAASPPAASPKQAASPKPAAPDAGGDVEAKIKSVGDEIRTLKEKLKGEGLSGKKINDHEEIKVLVAKLQELKAQHDAGGGAKASPKASPKQSPKASPKPSSAPAPAGGDDVEAQVKAVGDEIRVLKEKLKGEGLSGKKVNENEEIKALVAKLQELKKQL